MCLTVSRVVDICETDIHLLKDCLFFNVYSMSQSWFNYSLGEIPWLQDTESSICGDNLFLSSSFFFLKKSTTFSVTIRFHWGKQTRKEAWPWGKSQQISNMAWCWGTYRIDPSKMIVSEDYELQLKELKTPETYYRKCNDTETLKELPPEINLAIFVVVG